MAIKGRISIDEDLCKGCGYCEKFCTRECVKMQPDKLGPKGNILPAFVQRDKCNACSVCGWMCPECAIEVFKCVPGSTTS